MRGALVKTGKPITVELQKQANSEGVPIHENIAEFCKERGFVTCLKTLRVPGI